MASKGSKQTGTKGKRSGAKRSNTSRKKTNTRKNTSTRKGAMNNQKAEVSMARDIEVIAGFAVMILLMLSNFSLIGKVGDAISKVMFGIFGLFAYITPILLFIAISFFIANVSSKTAMKKLVAAVIMFLMLCTLLELIYAGTDFGFSMGKVYNESASIKNGGGVVGGFIAACLYKTIGIYGAYIAVIAIFLMSFVILSEKSLVSGVKKGSRQMYDTAKQDFAKMKINSADRLAKREHDRMERASKTVRGVATDTKIVDESQESADIHELINNGSLYRGHIDVEQDEHVDTNANLVQNMNQLHSEYESTNTEPDDYQIKNDDVLAAFEEKQKEDTEFAPKEQIFVSKEAKEVMNRKAFQTVPPVSAPTVSNERVQPVITDEVKTSGTAAPQNNVRKSKEYVMPPLNLLRKGTGRKANNGHANGLSKTAIKLQETLNAFGVKAKVFNESRGPSVTRYELQPETGTKVSRITSLADDIKLNLAASDIRIEAPIPGKAAVGIEVPNDVRESVFLRDLIESQELSKHPSKLAFAAGMDIAGKVVVADIAKMPHMLIAGTTGSGKSVFTNSIIMSILYRAKPSEVRLIIVDPKVVEFGVYNGIPHLLTPVVTEPRKAAGALNWAVAEMGERYQLFAKYNVRDLKGYNEKIKQMNYMDGDTRLETKPQIVIIIDELADLMMVAAKEVEGAICRLAQLARAAGIHLIIATQRPSVDVVTGLIKANIPSRVALLVSSGTDSRTIIDCNGGEKLLGNGDMLFYPSGYVKPVRLQGAFVSDNEVHAVVNFLVNSNQDVQYNEEVTSAEVSVGASDNTSGSDEDARDPLFVQAGKFVIEKEKGSTSMLQRMFKIGFNRASRIIDQLEKAGVVGSDEGTKPRKVLMTMEEFDKIST